MAWSTAFQPVRSFFPIQTQGPGVGMNEAVRIMQNYNYPPPPGYIFLKQLGAGGCGKVYLAKHCFTGCLFAVKCVIIIEENTNAMAQGLWNEVMILNANPHPHLIRCYGLMKSLTDQNISYLLLEYMEVGSVRHLYSNHTNTINEPFVRECISHVLTGLVHLHSLCIIHRDLKGDNILKDIKGFYKIADFGLSKRGNIGSASGIYSLMTAGVGTLSHMAPEVKTPASNVLYDTKADIWSLGCLVLEILSRGALTVDVNNHQALPVYTLPPGISPQCTHFMQCCLQVNPENRHTSSMLLKHDWFKM